MHISRSFRLLALSVLAVTLLSACGFQLRGDYQIPPQLQEVSLQAPARSELANKLEAELRRYDVTIRERGSDITHIELLPDSLDRRVLSLLVSGQVAEYELIYNAPIRIHLADGDIEEHHIQVFRDYQEDPNFALAKTRELELVVTEMREEAVRRLFVLLNRVTQE
ncbi:LPS assembly lipoprotein LptE [Aliidiomarina sp. Khilg15.8]